MTIVRNNCPPPRWLILHLLGIARRNWGNKFLAHLVAYADDSGSNSYPVSVLAGWIADAESWISFQKEWDDILRMRPRIGYFKFDEAMRFQGEFNGISEEMRNEKMKLFARCIRDHNLLGIRCTIEHKPFHEFFGKNDLGVLRTPYPMLFSQFISRVFREHIEHGAPYPKIDFIFDEQNNEQRAAVDGWYEMKETAVEPISLMLGSPPSFKSDKDVLPLQAADLIAGWSRYINGSQVREERIKYPEWTNILEKTRVITWSMDRKLAKKMSRELNRKPSVSLHNPIKYTFKFGL